MGRDLGMLVALLAIGCGRIGYQQADGDAGGIDSLSDDFGSGTLGPEWQVINPDKSTATVSGGLLSMRTIAVGQWFEDDQGGAVTTRVSGDFVITTLVTVVEASTGSPPIGPGLELAGVIAINPLNVAGARNSVWGGVGASDASPLQESKSTANSVSDYTQTAYPEPRGAVRLCRIGSSFSTYFRAYAGGAWTVHRQYDRPDMPFDLDVGAVASENTAPASIEARFEWITFTRPASAADCTAP